MVATLGTLRTSGILFLTFSLVEAARMTGSTKTSVHVVSLLKNAY